MDELERIRKMAKIRHEKERKKSKRKDFPLLPYECSWAFEEEFRRKQEKKKYKNIDCHP